MKTISTLFVATLFAAGNPFAFAQTTNAPQAQEPIPAALTNAAAAATAPPDASDAGTNGIQMNFSNAPLDLVLKYLSDAAGFHIIMDTPARGTVTVISAHPMTKDEAIDLLNSVLNKNGLAAIRNDPFLTIISKEEAATRDIPVKVYNDNPDSIPRNDEMVTQIIPIRFVEARQLVSDLSPFVSAQRIVANEAGNSIIVTDTQANIRHLAEIIKAIDSSAEASTEIRVFHLHYANPTDVATLLGGIFPSQGATGGAATPTRFAGGGGPGGFFARMMAANAANASPSQDRIKKQSQVIAVADLRTSSVVVTASKDLMDQIAGMIDDLDVSSARDQKVFVYHVNNGDPQAVAQVLQNAFGSSTTSRGGTTGTSQSSALQNREQYNAQQMGNTQSGSSSSTLGGSRGGGVGGGRTGTIGF